MRVRRDLAGLEARIDALEVGASDAVDAALRATPLG